MKHCLLVIAIAMAGSYAFAGLPSNIHSFNGVDPKISDDSDLAALDRVIGQAHNVGLGEGVHTSGAYYDFKFRMIRHLVRDKGFRVFAMETPRIAANATAKFLRDCATVGHSDPAEFDRAMHGFFPVFASESTRDLFAWLCDFNISHPQDAVNFYGFDTQETKAEIFSISRFVKAFGASDAATAAPLTELAKCAEGSKPGPVSQADREQCEAAIAALQQAFASPATFKTQPPPEQLAQAQLDLRGVFAFEEEEFYSSIPFGTPKAYEARDNFMADALQTERKFAFPNQRAVIWAHDMHLEKLGTSDNGMGPSGGAYTTMGEFLSRTWKDDYVSIGLVAYQQELNWPGVVEDGGACQQMPVQTDPNAVELMLRLLDQPYLIVDTKAMRSEANAFFNLNASYVYAEASHAPVDSEFDALVYIQHSPAMNSIFWPACPATPDLPFPGTATN